MSDRSIEEVAREVRLLADAASNGLGVTIESPFMQLSFLGLSVLPELRDHRQGSRRRDEVRAHRCRRALTDPTAT